MSPLVGRRRIKHLHLPPCVYERHGAFWYVKRGKWTRLGKTLEAALEAYARLFEPSRQGGMPGLIQAAMADLATRKPPLAANSLKQYRSAAKVLTRKLVQFDPHQVTQAVVTGIKVSMKATPNMSNSCVSLLRQVFVYALEQQAVPGGVQYGLTSNPCIGVGRHKEGARDRLITLTEYQAVYAKADARLQVIMDLLVRTGQRIGSVLRIERANLIEEGIRFPKWKTDAKGVVRWTAELREVVERAKSLSGTVRSLKWLITGRRGGPADATTVRRQWRTACKAAGVTNARLHDLRAMAATEAKRQGKDPTALLLHASAAQTKRYLRAREEQLVDGPTFGTADEE